MMQAGSKPPAEGDVGIGEAGKRRAGDGSEKPREMARSEEARGKS